MKRGRFQMLQLKKVSNPTTMTGFCCTLLMSILILVMMASAAYAAEVVLGWDDCDPQPDGYNIYVRAEGESYDYEMPTWTGSETRATIGDLTEGTTYYFVARSYIGDRESVDSIEISCTPGEDNQSQAVVIDDGSAGTSSTGAWHVSAGKEPYGSQSVYSIRKDSTYTYTSQISGAFEVALQWTYFSNRCQNVPVEIYDGDTLLNTVYINQRDNESSGQWHDLGNYDFSEQAVVKVIAQDNTCSTCADAVSFSGNGN